MNIHWVFKTKKVSQTETSSNVRGIDPIFFFKLFKFKSTSFPVFPKLSAANIVKKIKNQIIGSFDMKFN